jgi:hypothetical protein
MAVPIYLFCNAQATICQQFWLGMSHDSRSAMHERVFLTASKVLPEVLPIVGFRKVVLAINHGLPQGAYGVCRQGTSMFLSQGNHLIDHLAMVEQARTAATQRTYQLQRNSARLLSASFRR